MTYTNQEMREANILPSEHTNAKNLADLIEREIYYPRKDLDANAYNSKPKLKKPRVYKKYCIGDGQHVLLELT